MADVSLQADSARAIPVSRRALMAGIPAIAACAAVPAALASEHPDVAILDAWATMCAAYREFNEMPVALQSDNGLDAPEEARLWAIIEGAEHVIETAKARTIEGVEIQIWHALDGALSLQPDTDAARARNVAYFNARRDELNYQTRVLISALTSLQAMEA